ncbi:hypothetical protein [Rhodomicrobium sp.]|uniref:hypothetical protein n=1 Tax=Rhodomicrobium sp. TaxID=2720632 RepID=UPI0039E2BDB0
MAMPFDKCYARHLGSCDGKSREHFISKAILETLAPFGVQGFPWLKPGKAGTASPSSLASAILCKHHNNFLSDFDAEAAKLFEHLRLIDSKQTPKELSSLPSITIDGVLFEKWLLKVLCGAMASGNFQVDGKFFGKLAPSEYMVDMLFRNNSWPKGAGLFIDFEQRQRMDAFRGLGYDPVFVKTTATNAMICGIDIRLWGFPFRGLFVTYEDGAIRPGYRPPKLEVVNGSIRKEIHFEWPHGTPQDTWSILTRDGTIPDSS